MSHPTRHTSHHTRHTSHPTRHMLHLLKRVVFKYLEAVDIENAKEIAAFLRGDQQLVELGKEPNKAPEVKGFGQRVAAVVALSLLQRLDRRLVYDDNGAVAQAFLKSSSVDAKEPAARVENVLVGHGAAIALAPKNVAEMHDCDNQLKQLLPFFRSNINGNEAFNGLLEIFLVVHTWNVVAFALIDN